MIGVIGLSLIGETEGSDGHNGDVNGDVGVTGNGDASHGRIFLIGSLTIGRVGDETCIFTGCSGIPRKYSMFSLVILIMHAYYNSIVL
jgi:hypothetical protein